MSLSREIQIKVCTGTTCYLLGGAELLEIADQPGVDLQGMGCNGACRHMKKRKLPIVEIDGVLLSGVTPEQLLVEIARRRGEK